MATPTPTAQAAHLPTRQQLDEIDALLRRMLALPPLAGEAANDSATPPPAPVAPPAPVSYPAAIREVPPPRPPAPGDPVVQEWRVGLPQPPSLVAWGSPVPLATLAEAPYQPTDPPVPQYAPPGYYPAAALPLPVSNPDAAVPAGPNSARPVSPLLWPLIVLNVTFNVFTHLLGPLGTWLRGSGRSVMGWLGIGMILAAGVWAAGEWYGYDWPKMDASGIKSKLGLDR
jgi:hypothetical protein